MFFLFHFFQKIGKMEASLRFNEPTTNNIRLMVFCIYLDVLSLSPKSLDEQEKVQREFHI